MAKKSTSKLFQDEVKEELQEESMNLPEGEEVAEAPATKKKPAKAEKAEEVEVNVPHVLETKVDDDIQDIDLSVIQKKKFRINGDNNKILELNVSDMRIATRLKESYPRLNDLMDSVADKFADIPEDADEDELAKISDIIEEIDQKMRAEIDYIFDSNVSEICGDGGSMWDPIDGSFRYEHIIDKLAKLYENNLDKEFMDMKRRVETKTGKYVKLQDHNRKQK